MSNNKIATTSLVDHISVLNKKIIKKQNKNIIKNVTVNREVKVSKKTNKNKENKSPTPIPVSERTLSETISNILTTILSVYQLFGFKTENFDMTKTHEHWMSMCKDTNWMTVAKYKLAAFYAYHVEHQFDDIPQILPKAPFLTEDKPQYLLGGTARNWQKIFFHSENAEVKREFLESILQSKKGSERPGKAQVEEGIETTVKKLTTTPAPPKPKTESFWAIGPNYPKLFELSDEDNTLVELLADKGIDSFICGTNIKIQIKRIVMEIFKNKKYTIADRIKAAFPSTSANYIYSRGDAGAVSTLLDHPTLLEGLRVPGGYIKNELIVLDSNGEKINKKYINEYESISNETFVDVDSDGMKNAYGRLWFRMINAARDELPLVKPVGLSEPNKVRVITKGPGILYTVLKSLWKYVHTTMRNIDVFLIGKPVSENIIFNKLGANLNENEVLHSGDYKDATNMIKGEYTEYTAKCISEALELTDIEALLFTRSLTKHIFDVDGKQLPQQTGQLMGSITSFPILCIINAAMSRWSMEIADKRKYTLKDAKLLINGDDVALRADISVVGIKQRITAMVGLEDSLGKCYNSVKFVNMNSTSFIRIEPRPFFVSKMENNAVVLKKRYMTYQQVKYVNMGLLTGLKRSKGVKDLNDPYSNVGDIGACAEELLRLAPSRLHKILIEKYIKNKIDFLKSVRVPWCMPKWLGGLGIPDVDNRRSDLDRRIARQIIFNWKTRQPRNYSNKVVWHIRELATKSLPEPNYTPERGSDTESYEHIVGLKCIDTLFDSNINLAEMFNERHNVSNKQILEYNARLWTPEKGNLPEPMSDDELKFQPKYPTYDNLENINIKIYKIKEKQKLYKEVENDLD